MYIRYAIKTLFAGKPAKESETGRSNSVGRCGFPLTGEGVSSLAEFAGTWPLRRLAVVRRRLLKNEAGQSIILVALSMASFIGLGGIAVESGHGYLAQQKLVASTNAAALAGAAGMPDTTTASANVTAYSSVAGQKNATPLLKNVTATPTFLCLTTVSNTLNVGCMTATGGSGGYNSVKVTQTADVPSWFAGLFGIKTFHLSYSATAAMRGGTASIWNIAIVLDTTASMGSADGGAQCSGTRISCALKGVQTLLGLLYPCQLGQTCTSGSATFVDDVSLYVFPPVLTSTKGLDYCSPSSGNPTHEWYTLPTLPSTWTYQIIPYSFDYKVTDTSSGLNTSANIVKAVGYTGTSCTGILAPGGAGTYYAQVIYQAQADLIAQQNLHPGSRNAMIILSDGDATSSYTYQSGSTTVLSSTSQIQATTTGAVNGITYHNPTTYTYPSAVGECGQAVVAANAAATAGTNVFTIGYGSPTSGCTKDATYSATITTGGGTWAPNKSPCQALTAMASKPSNFYSDNANGCVATVPSNASLTTLTAIFRSITSSLTTPRLIPNGTT